MSLELIINQSGLEEASVIALREQFTAFYTQAVEWKTKAETIKVTDASQLREMKLARESRLALREIRTTVESRRKSLKEDSLRRGKAIDSIATAIKAVIEPVEDYLREQEEFAERLEAKRIASLVAERSSNLVRLGGNPGLYNLGMMSEAEYAIVLDQAQKAHDERIAAEQKVAAEKLAKEQADAAERQRLREENERLKAESLERIRIATEERKERERVAEAERNERQRIEAEHAAELNRQRAETERLAREARVAQEAAEARKASEAKAAAQAAAAPDREKMIRWAVEIRQMRPPQIGDTYRALAETITKRLQMTAQMLDAGLEEA